MGGGHGDPPAGRRARTVGTRHGSSLGGAGAVMRAERGSGTVLGLAVIAVAIILTMAVASLARVTAARGSAQTGADLAALAAAERLHATGSPGAACELAARVAGAHEVRLESCAVQGQVVQVHTSRSAGPGLTARATARAGPALGDLVEGRSLLGHPLANLAIGVHHRGVVPGAEELTDRGRRERPAGRVGAAARGPPRVRG